MILSMQTWKLYDETFLGKLSLLCERPKMFQRFMECFWLFFFLSVWSSLFIVWNSIPLFETYHRPVVEFDEKHFESQFFVKSDFWAYFAQALISLCSCITKYFTFCEFAQISKHFNQKPWARKGTYLTGTGEEHFELA